MFYIYIYMFYIYIYVCISSTFGPRTLGSWVISLVALVGPELRDS